MVINNPGRPAFHHNLPADRSQGVGEIYLMRLITKMVRPDELNDFSDKEQAAEQRPIYINNCVCPVPFRYVTLG